MSKSTKVVKEWAAKEQSKLRNLSRVLAEWAEWAPHKDRELLHHVNFAALALDSAADRLEELLGGHDVIDDEITQRIKLREDEPTGVMHYEPSPKGFADDECLEYDMERTSPERPSLMSLRGGK